MKVITVCGPDNSGKTGLMIEMLCQFDELQIIEMDPGIENNDATQTIKNRKNCRKGIYRDFTLWGKYNGCSIGITTAGDSKDVIEKDYEKIKAFCGKNPLDLFVCASHPYQNVFEYLLSLAEYPENLQIIVKKDRYDDCDLVKKCLYQAIKEVCKEKEENKDENL